ncbi:type II toxin-antitoxin system RelE/ParE family toxin [Stieleria varia]|uniref:Plasmid stabilization system protein n=1 Tax=Stieleria varia TaxID=2528005 RepID=A0A5C6B0W7_9BACT|nr:type II toxin-antitoxin system RelE/ParE family toxin [Stieleria varia]TWU05803.1 Plasmid stabilization system protein [Stieleria varia]
MAEIVWTHESATWLEKIHDHIAADNPTAALDVARGIYAKIQLLRTSPRLGGQYLPIADREVREILYGHYRIPYLVISEDRVEILGIFHSAMRIEDYLG